MTVLDPCAASKLQRQLVEFNPECFECLWKQGERADLAYWREPKPFVGRLLRSKMVLGTRTEQFVSPHM